MVWSGDSSAWKLGVVCEVDATCARRLLARAEYDIAVIKLIWYITYSILN